MRRTSFLMLCGCLIGCGEAPGGVSESEAPPDTLTAAPLVMIGVVDGMREYMFGRVVGVAAGRNGSIYVADGIGSSVRAYDQTGVFLGTGVVEDSATGVERVAVFGLSGW